MKNCTVADKLAKTILSLSISFSVTSCKKAEDSVESVPEPTPTIEVEEIKESPLPSSPTSEITDTENSEPLVSASDESGETLTDFTQKLITNELSYSYDVFDAIIFLDDGVQIAGIGYTDYASYFETEDGDYGYFAAGFIPYYSDAEASKKYLRQGVEIHNQEYEDQKYGFVYAYTANNETFGHFVQNGMYIKYGVDDSDNQFYTEEAFSREVVDTNLGALYSYDEKKFLYNPDIGNYVFVNGVSLNKEIDYGELENQVNAILENQDNKFSDVEIETITHYAKEALMNYWLSMQEEQFMGYSVSELVKEAETIDPKECIQFTSEGYVITDLNPYAAQTKRDVAKWAIGSSCAITVAATTALTVFVPAARPAASLLSGAAVQVFVEVVVENKELKSVNWNKVAVAAVSAACLAWACPLAASSATTHATTYFQSELLGKICGYGVQTFANGVVSGATAAAMAVIDGKSKEEVFNAALVGAAIGGACTIAAAALGELGQAAYSALEKTHPNNWLTSSMQKTSLFINKHQVHPFGDDIEAILNPKSVYSAAKEASFELNSQLRNVKKINGGSYKVIKNFSELNEYEANEIPSFNSTGFDKRGEGPAIRMSGKDHKLTASWGPSNDAIEYRNQQAKLIKSGNWHDAIQMDIDDIRSKFGSKYDEAITEMLEYAISMGWY